MRFAVWLLWFFPFYIFAQDYQVFLKDHYAGLLNTTSGDTILSPTYDALGWSNGSQMVVNGTIGFKNEGGWGVITLQKKTIVRANYYTIFPMENGLYKASIKGKFSNQLFYGLLSKDGDPLVSFAWFDIEKTQSGYIIYEYSKGEIKCGWMNEGYEVVIPVNYSKITQITPTVIQATGTLSNELLFDIKGRFIGHYSIYETHQSKIIVTKNGSFGLLDENGQPLILCEQKSISFNADGLVSIPFPTWVEIDSENRVAEMYYGDSISVTENWLTTFKNGQQQVVFPTKMDDIEILDISNDFWIGLNVVTNEHFAIDRAGKILTEFFDSLIWQQPFLAGKKDQEWFLMNRFGRKLSNRIFENIGYPTENLIPVMKNGYWGLVDFQGELVTPLKYDHLSKDFNERMFFAKFLGQWGKIDAFGNWIVPAVYDSIYSISNYTIGKEKAEYIVWDDDDCIIYKGHVTPTFQNGVIILENRFTSKYGILSLLGNTLLSVEYDSVKVVGEWAIGFHPFFVVAIDSTGKFIFDENHTIQNITGYFEGWYRIQKDNRVGYVDGEGRLRIANRYRNLGPIENGLLAAQVDKNWGLISLQEKIVVQPNYDSVVHLNKDLWLVCKSQQWGLMKSDGSWVLDVEYDTIQSMQDKGYILSQKGKLGFADRNGQIILRPEYEELILLANNRLLVKRKDKWGMLATNGITILPFSYSGMYISEQGRLFLRK